MLQDLRTTQEKLTRAEVRCQNLTAEKEMLKMTQKRLEQENDSLVRNQHSHDDLVFRLQQIQV